MDCGFTYVDDTLNGAKNGSDGLTNEGNGVEEAGLADEDVQKLLVDLDELVSDARLVKSFRRYVSQMREELRSTNSSESIEDDVGISTFVGLRVHAIKEPSTQVNNLSEACNDLLQSVKVSPFIFPPWVLQRDILYLLGSCHCQ